MTEIRAIVPADLEDWIKFRQSNGGYPDPVAYLFELARRDQRGLVADDDFEETPEQIAWLRERIAEGIASGISDKDPFEVIDELIAKHRPSNG